MLSLVKFCFEQLKAMERDFRDNGTTLHIKIVH